MSTLAFIKKKILIIGILYPNLLNYNIAPYYVLWDVGQGQWLSKIDSFSCIHIDVGGESFPKKVRTDCAYQEHYWWISHWDWDHYKFLKKIESYYAARKHHFSREEIIYAPKKQKGLSKNDRSQVLYLKGLLVSGDSTKKQEKIWHRLIPEKVSHYILGHHGSNTSSGEPLLQSLSKDLKQCFYSARKRKYGHPHPKVKQRLKKHLCPLIGTQNWSNIRFRIRN